MTEVSYLSLLCDKCNSLHVISAAWCVEETLPLVTQLSIGNQGDLRSCASGPRSTLPEQLETLCKLTVSPFQLDYNGLQIVCMLSSKALKADLEFPLLLSVRGSRKDHLQLQWRTHCLQPINIEWSLTEVGEFIQILADAQSPKWKLIFFPVSWQSGPHSDCNLGFALSKTPQCLRKLVSCFLVGGNTAVIYYISSTGTWLTSCHLTPKN